MPTRHYPSGHRCQAHTPAAVAGRPEPPAGPGWPRKPTAPAPDSAGANVIDARAVFSGKRRSSPQEYETARAEVERQKQRDRKDSTA